MAIIIRNIINPSTNDFAVNIIPNISSIIPLIPGIANPGVNISIIISTVPTIMHTAAIGSTSPKSYNFV